MSQPKLTLELLNGPLDGHLVTLDGETTWTKEGEGVLAFPWDSELGTPQARFFPEEGNWWLEHDHDGKATRSTRHNGERVTAKEQLQKGDMLKATPSEGGVATLGSTSHLWR